MWISARPGVCGTGKARGSSRKYSPVTSGSARGRQSRPGVFERRFLFKIRFERPSVEAKRHIWLDKLPGLAEREAGFLASNFDFSGGEIDNIVRKAVMMEVLDGEVPSIEALVKLCGEEKIGSSRQRIGFGN